MADIQRILELLEIAKISNRDLARIWGRTDGMVSKELAKKETSSLSFVKAIKKATGASFNYIIEGEEDQVVKHYYESRMAAAAEAAEPESKYGKELIDQMRSRIEDLKKLCTVLEEEVARLKEEKKEDGASTGKKVETAK